MAWASKKQYAILMNSEEGQDLAEQLPDLDQDEFDRRFSELLGKGGKSSSNNSEQKGKKESNNFYDDSNSNEEDVFNDDFEASLIDYINLEKNNGNTNYATITENVMDAMVEEGYDFDEVYQKVDYIEKKVKENLDKGQNEEDEDDEFEDDYNSNKGNEKSKAKNIINQYIDEIISEYGEDELEADFMSSALANSDIDLTLEENGIYLDSPEILEQTWNERKKEYLEKNANNNQNFEVKDVDYWTNKLETMRNDIPIEEAIESANSYEQNEFKKWLSKNKSLFNSRDDLEGLLHNLSGMGFASDKIIDKYWNHLSKQNKNRR